MLSPGVASCLPLLFHVASLWGILPASPILESAWMGSSCVCRGSHVTVRGGGRLAGSERCSLMEGSWDAGVSGCSITAPWSSVMLMGQQWWWKAYKKVSAMGTPPMASLPAPAGRKSWRAVWHTPLPWRSPETPCTGRTGRPALSTPVTRGLETRGRRSLALSTRPWIFKCSALSGSLIVSQGVGWGWAREAGVFSWGGSRLGEVPLQSWRGVALGRAVLRGGIRISKEGCPVFKAQWRLHTHSYKICSRSEFLAWAPRGVVEGSLMVKSPWDRQSQGLAFTRSFKDHHLLLWGPPPVSTWTTEGGGGGFGPCCCWRSQLWI